MATRITKSGIAVQYVSRLERAQADALDLTKLCVRCSCRTSINDILDRYAHGKDDRARMRRALLSLLARVSWCRRRLADTGAGER